MPSTVRHSSAAIFPQLPTRTMGVSVISLILLRSGIPRNGWKKLRYIPIVPVPSSPPILMRQSKSTPVSLVILFVFLVALAPADSVQHQAVSAEDTEDHSEVLLQLGENR